MKSKALPAVVIAETVAWIAVDSDLVTTAQGLSYLAIQSTVVVVALRRVPAVRTNSASGVLAATAWCWTYPYVVFFASRGAEMTTVSLWNLLFAVAALLGWRSIVVLDRSFGVRPALRRLVTTGPYRAMRHPLYASYMMADAALCLMFPRLAVLVVVASGWYALAYRIHVEEQVMAEHPCWPAYTATVRYRLLPGLI